MGIAESKDGIEVMSTKEHGSIAYSLKVQQETQELMVQTKKTIDRNNRMIKILCYALLFTCLMMVLTTLVFYQTNVLGQLIQAISKIRIN